MGCICCRVQELFVGRNSNYSITNTKKMIKLEKFIILLCHVLFPFLRSTLSIPWELRRQPHSLINLRVLVFPFEPVLDYFHIILKYV